MSVDYPGDVSELYIWCQLIIQVMSVDYPGDVSRLSRWCQWIIHVMSVDYRCDVSWLSRWCQWIIQVMSVDYTDDVSRLSRWYMWIIQVMPVDYPCDIMECFIEVMSWQGKSIVKQNQLLNSRSFFHLRKMKKAATISLRTLVQWPTSDIPVLTVQLLTEMMSNTICPA